MKKKNIRKIYLLLNKYFIIGALILYLSIRISAQDNLCNSAQIQLENAKISLSKQDNEKAIYTVFEIVNMGIQDLCPDILIESYSVQAQAFTNHNDIENSLVSYLNAIAVAEKNKSYSTLSNLYRMVGEIFYSKEVFPKAAEYFTLAYQNLSESTNYAEKLYLLESTGLAYFNYNNVDDAVKVYERLLGYIPHTSSSSVATRSFFQLSVIYRNKRDWGSAIHYSKRLLENMRYLSDTLGIILSMNNIGYYQVQNRDYADAETTLLKAIDHCRAFPASPLVISGLYTNLAICYQNQGIYSKAISNLNNAKEFINQPTYALELAELYNTMAWVYYRKGDTYNASRHSKISIEWASKANNSAMLAESYRTYSMLLKQSNDHIGALAYFEKYSIIRDSLEIENRISEQTREDLYARLEKAEKEQRLFIADKEMQALMLKQLRLESEGRRQEIELLLRQTEVERLEKDRAFQALELSKRQNESALQLSTIRNLEQANAIKEFQIKQKEAEELQRVKEIALLQSETEKQQLQIEKETETRKRAIWMLILSFLSLVIVIVGLVVTRKKNALLAEQKLVIEQKNINLEQANIDITEKNIQLSELAEEVRTQNEEITAQKEMIEETNKNITDSILYASLIQTAVLPQDIDLAESFSDYFVLFKPRDIVSGDFWWLNNQKERTILAVADCTGHGVPGAFLSMLGTTLLDEIANYSPNISANKLLDELKVKMVEVLVHGKTNDPRRDGMDIAVCIFNKKTLQVDFAGANNPLYIVSNGEIEVIKPDKAPIGLSPVNKDFTLKTYNAKPGDRFFLFSDGYPDQFGGENGRKLMYKTFRELLVKSSHLPMCEQKEFLDTTFNEWKGYLDQVDDVLVVGVSV
jgi:serine phosphatase RsbU (regulator of sigma subunit)